MRDRRQRLVLVLFLLTALLAGCRHATPTPIPGVPQGWTLHESKDAGFALALPPGWLAKDISSGQMAIVVQELAKEHPGELDPQWLGTEPEPGCLIAIDLSPKAVATGAITILTVSKSTESQDLSVQDVTRMAAGLILDMQGQIDGQWTHVTAQAGAMLELRAHITVHDAKGNPVTVAECVYAFAHGKDAYVLSMATTSDHFSVQIPINRDIARSFRLLE